MVKLSQDDMFKVIGISASVVVSLICFCAEGPSVESPCRIADTVFCCSSDVLL